jgi:myo-inositol-1(or 4)-monophosphatase
MLPDIDELAALVKAIAREEILPRFNHAQGRLKADGSIVTEVDFAMQRRLAETLGQRYPGIALLGEEMDEPQQEALLAKGGRLWCLDPVDGTSNFVAGMPFFCVSLALLVEGASALGLIYDPVRDECYKAVRGQGARLNGAELKCRVPDLPLKRCMAVVDFKRLDPVLATRLALKPPYSAQRYLGSGALEWCWLAAGRFQAYLHGGQKLWDYAAGALILAEAGGTAATIRGEPITTSSLAPLSVMAACDARLFAEWRAALAGPWAEPLTSA